MLNKIWQALTKPIIPPTKAEELQTKTDNLAVQVRAGMNKIITTVKDKVQSPGILQRIENAGKATDVLGAGDYVYYCRGHICRSENPVVRAREIMALQCGDTRRLSRSIYLYHMPRGYIEMERARVYRADEQIDLRKLPEMEDPLYGFGIFVQSTNDIKEL